MKPTHQMPYSSRIRIERLKQCWTQEQLAEKTNLSTRTIQRIENGAEASAHTLSLLAETFGISIEELTCESKQRHFRAIWDTKLKIITASICTLFLIAGIFSNAITCIALLLIIAVCSMFSITGYSIDKGMLHIHRLGWSKKFNLSELTLLQHEKNVLMGSIRVFGNGGLFAYVGKFRNTILGNYNAYLTNTEDCLVIGFEKKKIVISPEKPEQLKKLIEEELKSIN